MSFNSSGVGMLDQMLHTYNATSAIPARRITTWSVSVLVLINVITKQIPNTTAELLKSLLSLNKRIAGTPPAIHK